MRELHRCARIRVQCWTELGVARILSSAARPNNIVCTTGCRQCGVAGAGLLGRGTGRGTGALGWYRAGREGGPGDGEAGPVKVVGGQEAGVGSLPWMVFLYIQIQTGAESQYSACGASLLNSYWVITAIHCVVEARHKTLHQW